jgi:hypothetical protein
VKSHKGSYVFDAREQHNVHLQQLLRHNKPAAALALSFLLL